MRSFFNALSLSTVAIILSGCGPQASDRPAMTAPPVEAVQARTGSLPLVERLSGTVWAENQVSLYPEITGRVAEVFVTDGESVEVGQPLVRLVSNSAQEQVRQAEAGLRIEEARLRQSNAALAEVEAQVNRYKALGDRNLVSDVEMETLNAQRETAAADVELAEARVEQAASTLAERNDALNKTVVRAPISGVVGGRNAELGMQVTSSTMLFTIGNLERVSVRINLTDTMLRYIEIGQNVRVFPTDAGSSQPLTAKLTRISPFLNRITRSTEAEIELVNTAGRLRPGMFVPVDILYGQSRQATLVPTSAIFTDPNTGREGVFVTTSAPTPTTGTELGAPVPVVFRPVTPIARGATEVAVDLIQPDDWIVTLGQNLLATGRNEARVRTVSWDHVMDLQSMRREELLADVLKATSTANAN